MSASSLIPHAFFSVPETDVSPRVCAVAVLDPSVVYLPVDLLNVTSPETKPVVVPFTVMTPVTPVKLCTAISLK